MSDEPPEPQEIPFELPFFTLNFEDRVNPIEADRPPQIMGEIKYLPFTLLNSLEYAMLDTGAASNYCSEELFNDLQEDPQHGCIYFEDDTTKLSVKVGDKRKIPSVGRAGIILHIENRPYMIEFISPQVV